MIERCGDRQLKHDGLKKWPFRLFIESLPVMLQIALLLLACGLSQQMASINTTVASVLITLTALGVLFYLGIVIAGTASYECPFQTPVSTTLCTLWKKIGPKTTTALVSIVTTCVLLFKCLPWVPVLATLHHLWEAIQCQILNVLLWLPLIWRCHHSQSASLPIAQPNPQEHTSWLAPLHSLWETIQCKILHVALCLPHAPPNTTVTSTWLTPLALSTLQKTNTHDVLCVSWVLWHITDPEALDAAIQLASTIRWFEDGLNTEPPYDLIISSLKTCFDSTGKIYPGSRDRAYSSAQAIIWIHTCAMCVSEEFGHKFPLPHVSYHTMSLDKEFIDLLGFFIWPSSILTWMFDTLPPTFTPAYSQWSSNALLHLLWAKQDVPDAFSDIGFFRDLQNRNTIPMNTLVNHLLASCIFLGRPIDKEVLKIQDKSYVISFLSLPLGCSHCCLLVIT